MAGSIGIIGGADGPTAIFVSCRLGSWLWLAGLGALAAVAAVAVLVVRRKKRKNNRR